MNAVAMTGLTKAYTSGKPAVDAVSLTLEPGEVFGFLGPNGAGKTTTVKLLEGMLAPTGGSCSVFGTNPGHEPEKVHALSGVVTEHAQMYDSLTGAQNLVFFGDLYGLSPAESRGRAEELLALLELEDAGGRRLAAYSTGMRQRLSLARALVHRPKILFLDEPTSGLDPESAQNVHRLIRRLAEREGVTVFLCTHQLRYAQEVCTRYGLMSQGRLLALGTLEALREKAGRAKTVRVRAKGAPEGFAPFCTGPGEYLLPLASEAELPKIARGVIENGGELYQLSAQLPSLEEVYFALTQAEGKEGAL